MNMKAKGYILGAVAAATYGMNPLFALPLYKAGMNPDSVLFFRYLFAIPILGVMIRARGRHFTLRRREVLPLVVMGLLVPDLVPELQLYGGRYRIDVAVRLSDYGRTDYGGCFQGKIDPADPLVHCAGVGRDRLAV